MNEFDIKYNVKNPQKKDADIIFYIDNIPEEDLLYKFILGFNGKWNTIKDFGAEEYVKWSPKEEGIYTIMVQAKRKDSIRGFDYVSKIDYIVGNFKQKLIQDVYINKTKFKIGDKLSLMVDPTKFSIMYRYWIKQCGKSELIKDYSAENTLNLSLKIPGIYEILVECKDISSKKDYDDLKSLQFEVIDIKRPEIVNFKCLNSELLVGKELIFQIDASYDDKRIILYKFIKINSKGISKCIQDYSTKRIVSYVEEESGDYKILCMVKDMYSQNEFDDRAIINFKIKPYKEISIKSFTTDLNSPQISGTPINLKAIVNGGKELLYRFKIDGNYSEDSGYIRNSNYIWKPKIAGEYKIILWVKDISFYGMYEAKKEVDFVIDEESKEPIRIDNIILDKGKKVLIKEPIEIKVFASGGINLRYSFIIKYKDKKINKVDYGMCNWTKFIPDKSGIYELEVRVKDKYSTRKFDSHSLIYIEAYEYIPANIDYILFPPKQYYVYGDTIMLNVITENTNNVLIKYILRINEHKIEETEFVNYKKYSFVPKCKGTYYVDIYAKDKKSTEIFDCKKSIEIVVNEALPVTSTKIQYDRCEIVSNEAVTFTAKSEGGKDVLYEFYLMEKGEWNLVQRYSKKNYYTFIPFSNGKYKILVLAKSQYKKIFYEDYYMLEFNVK